MDHAPHLHPTRGLTYPLAVAADRPTRETATRSCAYGTTQHDAAATQPRPVLRVAAVVAALSLSWGAFHVTHTLRTSHHSNTPVSSSSQAPGQRAYPANGSRWIVSVMRGAAPKTAPATPQPVTQTAR